jgi:hypothetical protein
MKEVTYESGLKLLWDDRIQVGSIITAYRPGYHIVTSIEDRGKKSTPLIHYRTLLNSKGKKSKNTSERCDASYCRLASEQIPKHIQILEEYIQSLKNFQAEHDL